MQGRLFRIADASHILGHDPVEHVVDSLQYLFPAPEVLVQFDLPAGGTCFCLVIVRISMILFLEQLRPGQTELVDALLHVPYHKHIGLAEPFPGYGQKQGLLDQVAVLVLVHQNLRILAA